MHFKLTALPKKLRASLSSFFIVLTAVVLPTHTSVAKPYVIANVGKAQAAEKARAKHGGKVLGVSEKEKEGRTIYRVKLLLDGGKIIYVTVDSSNGRVS